MRDILDSRQLFTGPIFEIERDRIRDLDGSEIVRDVVRHPGGAGALPFFPDGRVALVRQYRHPARRDLLEIPAGRIEPGESPEWCARREVEQEIGFRVGRLTPLAAFYSTPGFCEELLSVFLATELSPGQQQLDHDERIEILYLPFEQALRMAREGEIEDSKTLIALLLAERHLVPGRI
jgi:ADP-ribose pyrophosphatase